MASGRAEEGREEGEREEAGIYTSGADHAHLISLIAGRATERGTETGRMRERGLGTSVVRIVWVCHSCHDSASLISAESGRKKHVAPPHSRPFFSSPSF